MKLVRSRVASDINLSELQKTLDVQGIEVVENQKEGVVGRKALADKTKGRDIQPFLQNGVFSFLGQTSKRYPTKRKSMHSRAY